MSDVGDSSQPFADSASPELNPEARTTSEVMENTSQSVRKLKFNYFGLPIGPGSEKAATKLGKLAKTNIPISYTTWRKVSKDINDAVWKELKESCNYKDSQRDAQMKKACDAWKKYKGKMRKGMKGNDLQKWLEACSQKGMAPDHWHDFCLNEHMSTQIKLRERNKMIKNTFGKQSTHNTGRLGYARAEEKFKEKHNGRNPMRVELWL
ncbi:hypothetical protein FRX31_024771 [Thalictrum thalictroides]|uniref:Uncharacterized protein n=1 Tax=Thalictrum thalictroides TaxID=46969 RepID=A0A7J6VKK7_THATH|nr:hypothetical protein FRX31_024771 [Thalictrum thalictroides]